MLKLKVENFLEKSKYWLYIVLSTKHNMLRLYFELSIRYTVAY